MSDTNYVKYTKNSVLKKIAIVISVAIILIVMLGVKNATRVEHSMFVVAIGIDKSPTDPDKILVTFQIVPPQVTSQSSTDISKVIVTSINEDSLEKAVASAHNYMSAVINFSHTRAVVFSDEIAKEGISKYLTSISSNKMYDTNMYVMVCRGKAQTYLESLSQDTEINPLLYYNIIRNSQYVSSATKTVTVMEFLKQLYDPYVQPTAPVCNIVDEKENASSNKEAQQDKNEKASSQGVTQNTKETTSAEPSDPISYTDKEAQEKSNGSSSSGGTQKEEEGDKSNSEGKIDNTATQDPNKIQQKSNIKIEVGGMAVFNEDKLVGFLTAEETAYHLMLNNKITNYYLNIRHKEKENIETVTNVYLWQQQKATVKVDLRSDIPLIDITIPLNAGILDTKNETYDFHNEEYMNKMKELIITELEKNMKNYSDKLQKEYKADIDDFIEFSKKSFLTTKQMKDYDWNKKFLKAKIKTNFDIRFVTSGLSTQK